MPGNPHVVHSTQTRVGEIIHGAILSTHSIRGHYRLMRFTDDQVRAMVLGLYPGVLAGHSGMEAGAQCLQVQGSPWEVTSGLT